ncbi:hypothetical protein DGo_PB0245 (plasmid) [Deinococcus gobiensis I-0]|uniref:Uncharacterized protein n=1 Tax=Deinococcus gobiensis (strain DSM 21396 / JCM 16679 / CGMCC 1.7299 / I-0) TaxID=745776 RepID=H8H1W7_DEIGI|nr:hypothetical protein DGo_PB0245 [Deinococcus gobiensis I-0]
MMPSHHTCAWVWWQERAGLPIPGCARSVLPLPARSVSTIPNDAPLPWRTLRGSR